MIDRFRNFRRAITVILTAAMVITSLSGSVFAGESDLAGTCAGTDEITTATDIDTDRELATTPVDDLYDGSVTPPGDSDDDIATVSDDALDGDSEALPVDDLSEAGVTVSSDTIADEEEDIPKLEEGEPSATLTIHAPSGLKSIILEQTDEDGLVGYVNIAEGAEGWTDKGDGIEITVESPSDKMSYRITEIVLKDDVENHVRVARVYVGGKSVGTGVYGSECYDLGVVGSGLVASIETAALKVEDIGFAGDIDDSAQTYIQPGVPAANIIEVSGEIYIAFSGCDEGLPLELALVNNSDKVNYRIKSPLTWTVGDNSRGELKAVFRDEIRDFLPIPLETLADAAFSGSKLTVNLKLEELGSRRQKIEFIKDYEMASTASIRVEGEPIYGYLSSIEGAMTYEVDYNCTATVTVKPERGYKIKRVRYIDDSLKRTLESQGKSFLDIEKWVMSEALPDGVVEVPVKNGEASFKLKNIKEKHYVLVESDLEPALVVNGEEIADNSTVETAYNVPCDIWVESMGIKAKWEDVWVYAVAEDGSNKYYVTEEAFGNVDPKTRGFKFNGSHPDISGKTVTIILLSKIRWSTGPNRNKPIFNYSFKIKVGPAPAVKAAELEDEAVVLSLGVDKDIPVTLGKGFKADSYDVAVYDVYTRQKVDYIKAEKSKDGKTVTLSTKAADHNLLINNYRLELRLTDSTPGADTTVFDSARVTVNTDQVKNANLSGIKVQAGDDSVTFDFGSGGNFSPETDGLYYLLDAQKQGGEVPAYKSRSDVLVPVSEGSYKLVLTDNNEISGTPVEYRVSVKLVQVSGTGADETHYEPGRMIAISDSEFRNNDKTIKTTVEGTFPTKINFKKNKKMPVLYDTMDENVVLGTVSYSPLKGKKHASVERVSRVEVNGNPAEYATYYGNRIRFNPNGLKPGKYKVTVYAVGPAGKEASCSYTVKVVKGIDQIRIKSPGRLYKKTGKVGSISASASFNADSGIAPKSAKVKWSLQDAAGKEFKYKGISISKKGKVTVAKSVTIPEEGLVFYIAATAADHKREVPVNADPVEVQVHAYSDTIAHIVIGETEVSKNGSYSIAEINGIATAYNDDMQPLRNVSFKVKGLKKEVLDDGSVRYYATKPVKKVTVTATATDGSKKKKTVTFSVKK